MKRNVVVCAVLFLAAAAVAEAGPITAYGTHSSFNAAVGATVTDDFGAEAAFPIWTGILDSMTDIETYYGGPIRPGRVQPGVQYSTPIGYGSFFNIDAGGGFTGGFLDGGLGNYSPLTVSFATPVAGFGFDTNSLMGSEFYLAITFASGPAFEQTLPVPASNHLMFYGFASSASDILSARIVGVGNQDFTFALDNFAVAHGTPVDPVPEPSSIILLGTGLVGMARAWRRKR